MRSCNNVLDFAYESAHRLCDKLIFHRHTDHLGSATWITDTNGLPVQYILYDPWGGQFANRNAYGSSGVTERYTFTGKEFDEETKYYNFEARQYDHWLRIFTAPDPLSDQTPDISPYAYCAWNPLIYFDPDGREPNKAFIGTAADFREILDNSPSRVGLFKGQIAANYMLRLSNTKFISFKIVPTETGFFNKKRGRYIYTQKAGWIDMTHFMFYAGRAYKYKSNGEKNPINKAVQDGYHQEKMDSYLAPHSAYSYEDLPTDKVAAVFGATIFDPNSNATLGEQIENYLNTQLMATDPQNAPNINTLPLDDNTKKPSVTNKTTKPIYTKDE